MKALRGFIFVLVIMIVLSGCAAQTAQANERTLTVFAAASLRDVFEALAEDFEEQHPGVEVIFNFGGSQILAEQIANGAPADVFASAAAKQMDAVVATGRVDSQAVQIFAHNQLVVVVSLESAETVKTPTDLADDGVAVILAAKEVPAGKYALEYLEKAALSEGFGEDFAERVLANVRSYEENVRSVLSKIQLGEADAGIIYQSDVWASGAEGVTVIEIPADLNVTAEYPLAVVKDSQNAADAQAWVDYVLGPRGQTVLAAYGFLPR